MTREQLIELCQDAVVHHTKWSDRDSYCAQKGIQSVYEGLTAGLRFRVVTKKHDASYHSDEKTLIIEFLQPIDFQKLKKAKRLEISTIEDYFKDCDSEHQSEMFDGDGIDFYSSYTKTYMPTRQRLDEVGKGNDWY